MKYNRQIALIPALFTLALFSPPAIAEDISINVDFSEEISPVNRFWRCTGHKDGPYEAKSKQYWINTMYIGGVPHNSMEYLRLHNLPHTVKADNLASTTPTFDWSGLDAVLDQMVDNGLRPNFELMGGPQGMSWRDLDFINSEQDRARWKYFVSSLAKRYIDRYGVEEVRKWVFETENECGPCGDARNMAIKGMADRAGLMEADSQLVYGGPGRSGSDGNGFVQYFLSFFHDSLNPFTGEVGTELDFVEYHAKGPYWWAVQDAKDQLTYIRSECPDFASAIQLVDDESDPVAGHGFPYAWRIGPTYAAMVACRVWASHTFIEEAENGNYLFMNQDNAFVHSWPGRSLVCRFRGQNEDHLEMIKKTSINTYEMLSLLGDRRIEAGGYESPSLPTGSDKNGSGNVARVEAMATRDSDGRIAVLAFNNREYYISSTPDDDATVTLTIGNVPFDKGMLVQYRIDETHSNVFRVWQEMGGPVEPVTGEVYTHVRESKDHWETFVSNQGPYNPTAEQFHEMRDRMELETMEAPREVTIAKGTFDLTFDLAMPSVALIVLAPKPADAPGAVTNVRSDIFDRGITDERHTFVRWNEVASKYIKTYEILWSPTENGDYTRVNNADFFSTTFLHVHPASDPVGYYKVRAVDYWGRLGPAVGEDGQATQSVSFTGTRSTDIPSFKVNGTVLTVNNPLKRDMEVIINDARGKIVQSIRLSNHASIDLNARGLSAGVYYCSVAGRDIRKFSIIR
ncbi:MAG: hypothetical protein GF398_12295 [Chitinivibrionales bacterium]|nr:hypothetical protein [Chitinivibrionales bacterium]